MPDGASLENIASVTSKSATLRTFGFRIALDDLGAGYAGLTSFALLEPEFVKLDMGLIREVNSNKIKQKIVRTMVQEKDEVVAGQPILVMEAMKMQNAIKSPKDGRVQMILTSEGSTVNAGDTLAVIETFWDRSSQLPGKIHRGARDRGMFDAQESGVALVPAVAP